MNIAYIGLGKMGRNMALRMQEKGHTVIAFDPNKESTERAMHAGISTVTSLAELFPPSTRTTPKTIWMMVPHSAVDHVLDTLIPLLSPKDTVIDGGNSPYKETVRRAKKLGRKGIHLLDVGVSGGPTGARHGACLMVGGDPEVFDYHEPLFLDLATKQGCLYVGVHGAGHFTKMVHNGIEYGMMQAIAEGFDVLRNAPYELPLTEIARLYDHGSVIESKLMGWLVSGLDAYGEDLAGITGRASASGEGLWTIETAQELEVPVKVLEHALKAREKSQKKPSYQGQIVSVLRNQFGGHEVTK
jgi:6-phosphogluconate dehydrogenase